MGVSDDRWTCPYCNRAFVLPASFGGARDQLEAVRGRHRLAHDKVSGRGHAPRGGRGTTRRAASPGRPGARDSAEKEY